jgi:hypothetical protein
MANAEANSGVGNFTASAGPTIADIHLRLHDPEAAELALKTAKEDPDDLAGNAMIQSVRGRLALEARDIAPELAELEAFGAAYANPVVSGDFPGYHCWIALAKYEEALKYAPNWKQLKEAREALEKQKA